MRPEKPNEDLQSLSPASNAKHRFLPVYQATITSSRERLNSTSRERALKDSPIVLSKERRAQKIRKKSKRHISNESKKREAINEVLAHKDSLANTISAVS